VGGVLAYVYQADGIAMKPLLAMNIGVSAPLILKTLVGGIPKELGRVN
jgi:thiol:disulfide interchange protein